jgi:hypothetical protein
MAANGTRWTVQLDQESGMMPHAMDNREEHEEQKRKTSGPLAMVKRFYAITEALVAKSALDSAGIDSLLADEDVVQMVYPNLVGGLKLMVRPEDLETAVQLLSQVASGELPEEDETDLGAVLRKAARQYQSGEKKE